MVVAKPECVEEQIWNDWLVIRKKKNAPLTETAWNQMQKEANKAGWPIEKAIQECCLRTWAAFKADWIVDQQSMSKTGLMNKKVISGLTRGLIGGDNNVRLLGN
jgi:hypothetical protein